MEGKCYFFNHFLSETYYDSIFFTIFALETVPVVWRGIIYKAFIARYVFGILKLRKFQRLVGNVDGGKRV